MAPSSPRGTLKYPGLAAVGDLNNDRYADLVVGSADQVVLVLLNDAVWTGPGPPARHDLVAATQHPPILRSNQAVTVPPAPVPHDSGIRRPARVQHAEPARFRAARRANTRTPHEVVGGRPYTSVNLVTKADLLPARFRRLNAPGVVGKLLEVVPPVTKALPPPSTAIP
jgi:hypothetical protein